MDRLPALAALKPLGPPHHANATRGTKASAGSTIVIDSRMIRVTSGERVKPTAHSGNADLAVPKPLPVDAAEATRGLMSVSRWR